MNDFLPRILRSTAAIFMLAALPCLAQNNNSPQMGTVSISADSLTFTRPPATQPYLGVTVESPSETLRSQLKLSQGVGLVVKYVDEKSPAHGVVKQHDILEKLDDQLLVNGEQLQTLVHLHKPGDAIQLTLLREASRNIISLNLGQKEASEASVDWAGTGNYWGGILANGNVMITRNETGMSSQLELSPIYIANVATTAPTTKPAQESMLEMLSQPAGNQIAHATISGPLTIDDGQTVTMLQAVNGATQLTVLDRATGKVSFSGSISNEKQWRELPDNVRTKLEGYKSLLQHSQPEK